MLRLARLWKHKLQASITIETTIVMSVVMFVLVSAINLSIFLYRDGVEASQRQIPTPPVGYGKLLRIKHMGGDLYEQYKRGDYV